MFIHSRVHASVQVFQVQWITNIALSHCCKIENRLYIELIMPLISSFGFSSVLSFINPCIKHQLRGLSIFTCGRGSHLREIAVSQFCIPIVIMSVLDSSHLSTMQFCTPLHLSANMHTHTHIHTLSLNIVVLNAEKQVRL